MIYHNQYVLLKRRVELPEFTVTQLWDGWFLHAHRALRVSACPENKTLLLGLAWQTLPGRRAPEDELRALQPGPDGAPPIEALLQAEESWCGRYVLLCGQRVMTDATGKLGAYYARDALSSNLALLAAVLGLSAQDFCPGEIMNWMPGPLTPYEEIRRCLPSQLVCLDTGEPESRTLLADDLPALPDEAALLAEILRCTDESIRNLQQLAEGRTLMAALTGGYDSRALFGLLKHAGASFEAFTLQHDRISAADTALPPVVCERGGVAYTYVPRDAAAYDPGLEQDYLAFTSGLIRDEDRVFYAHGQYQQLLREKGPCWFLRSSIWGTLAERYAPAFDENGPNQVFYDWFCVPEGSRERRSLALYLAWMKEHPQPGLCPADAFFWDQREGCWMEPIEDGFDMLEDGESLQLANCRYLLSLFARFPREERVTKAYEAKLALAACPALEGIPYSVKAGKQSKLAFLLKKGRKALDRLKKMGLKKTILTYGSIFSRRRELRQIKKKN